MAKVYVTYSYLDDWAAGIGAGTGGLLDVQCLLINDDDSTSGRITLNVNFFHDDDRESINDKVINAVNSGISGASSLRVIILP